MLTEHPRACLVAIEGIDGSGKKTHSELLRRNAEAAGLAVRSFSFPRYHGSLFGNSVAEYLNGRYGGLRGTPPEFAALLFAGDRLEALADLITALTQVDLVICDRYVPSNLAHQSARLPNRALWHEFQKWVATIEYNIYRLPKPDVTLYLDVPVEAAVAAIEARNAAKRRTFLSRDADLHEADIEYLRVCREAYESLSGSPWCGHWIHIACAEAGGGRRWPGSIAEEIWGELRDTCPGHLQRNVARGEPGHAASRDLASTITEPAGGSMGRPLRMRQETADLPDS